MTNQVHHVQLNEETRMLSKKVYGHTSGEVWEISSSHGDPKLFSTRHSQVDGTTSGSLKIGGSVWKIPEDSTGPDRYMSSGEELDLVCHLRSEHSDEVDHISWLPSADAASKVMVLANNRLALHDISVVNGVDDARLVFHVCLLHYPCFIFRPSLCVSSFKILSYLYPHLCSFISCRCSTVIATGQLDGKHGHDRLTTGSWNPHQNCQQYATANEHQVK